MSLRNHRLVPTVRPFGAGVSYWWYFPGSKG